MPIDPATLRGNWSYPTQVRFGPGRIAELADACRAAGIAKPLLVTDPGLAQSPMVLAALAALEAHGLPVALFSELRPNPVSANVEAGVRTFRAGGHDGVVAFGGGSALDTGKAIAFLFGQTRPLWDFEDVGDWWTRANADAIAPVVAVPTTAGTGSEVGRAAVITDEASHVKKVIFHPRMLPKVVIADPTLTLGLPRRTTAATGMDALAHCLEAYCAVGFHPIADGVALEGLRLLHDWLAEAVRDGANLAARAHVMAAASMGAAAFQKGLGAIHALSHPLGAVLDTHHGETNGVFLPYVLAFNRRAIEARIARVAAYLGVPGASFDGFLAFTLALRRELGIPHTARELGMTEAHVERFAEMAAVDPTAPGNPVPLDVPKLRSLYASALAGRLEGIG
jgi:alcohol dehydrogenase